MKYYCGISFNQISKLISVLHLFDDNNYYHGSRRLGDVKDSHHHIDKNKYSCFFEIDEELFNKLIVISYNDIKDKSLNKIIKDFNLEKYQEWMI